MLRALDSIHMFYQSCEVMKSKRSPYTTIEKADYVKSNKEDKCVRHRMQGVVKYTTYYRVFFKLITN